MGIFVSIHDHAALSWGRGYTIHASRDTPSAVVTHLAAGHNTARTVCGSDVRPRLVGTSSPGDVMLMSWPPPPGDRCVDCIRILGRPRRPRGGWGLWDRLIDLDSEGHH